MHERHTVSSGAGSSTSAPSAHVVLYIGAYPLLVGLAFWDTHTILLYLTFTSCTWDCLSRSRKFGDFRKEKGTSRRCQEITKNPQTFGKVSLGERQGKLLVLLSKLPSLLGKLLLDLRCRQRSVRYWLMQ